MFVVFIMMIIMCILFFKEGIEIKLGLLVLNCVEEWNLNENNFYLNYK